MSTVKIPSSLEGVKNRLGALGGLIFAQKWERAALVAAVVRLDLGNGGRNEASSSGHFLSANAFAELGIIGLRGTSSVTKYVQAWLDANGDEYPEPGQRVELPAGDFPPMRTGTDGANSPTGLRNTLRTLEDQHGPDELSNALTSAAPSTARQAGTKQRNIDQATIDETTKQRTGSTGGFKPTPDERLLQRANEQHRWLSDMASCARALCDAADDGHLNEGTARGLVDGIYAEALDRLTALRFDLASRYAEAEVDR